MMKIRISAVMMCAMLCVMCAGSATEAAKKSKPVYEMSGRISGTELQYENLVMNENDVAVVTIHNPTGTGISFNVTFSFFDAKGNFLDSFTVSGFAPNNSRATHVEEIVYQNIRTAKSVKVLGRAGRTQER